ANAGRCSTCSTVRSPRAAGSCGDGSRPANPGSCACGTRWAGRSGSTAGGAGGPTTASRSPMPWASVHQAALTEAGGEPELERGDQPRPAVADPQHRRPKTAADQVGEEVVPGVGRLRRRRGEAHEHGATVDVAVRAIPVAVLGIAGVLVYAGRTA